jgi:hypothetical protein
MKTLRTQTIFAAALLLLSSVNVFAAVRERPISDWVGSGGRRTNNWATQFGEPGIYAVVSRDDFYQPQGSFDSSVIIVSGKLLEIDQRDGSVKILAILHYKNLPLEVWTTDAFLNPITKILDFGSMSADAQYEGTLPFAGATININVLNLTRLTFAGNGTAIGTGLGDFLFGQKVKVHITQVGLFVSPANPKSAVGRDFFPAESIILH